MKPVSAALLLAATLILAAARPAGAQAPVAQTATAEVRYVVRAGDTLIMLADRYMVASDSWIEVQRLNSVANPRRMPIGLVLRIPRRLLRGTPVAASIFAFRGGVTVTGTGTAAAGGSARGASVGMALTEGDRIGTAANAFVTVRLADGSRFSLPSNSRVGIRRLRRILLTGELERAFAVEQGRGEWQVAPTRNKDPFTVTTPIATAAVRGTAFRVEAAGVDDVSFGVVEGSVAVTAPQGGAAPLLAAGTGVAASTAGVGDPVPLLPAPLPVDPMRIQQDEAVSLAVAPLPGAARYRFALSLDAEGERMIATTDSDRPVAAFADIADGHYFARASAIDGQGIEGLATTWPLGRKVNAVTAEAAQSGGIYGRGVYNFRWRTIGEGRPSFRFVLSRDPQGRDRVVDRSGIRIEGTTVTDLPDGVYWWRVWAIRVGDGAVGEAATPPQKLVASAGH